MNTFEMSCAAEKNGRRHFKLIMHEIYPESAFNADGTVSIANRNGISWREKWTLENMHTVAGTFLRVEFTDSERSEMLGHGMTGYTEDDMPEFCDATTVGVFTGAEIMDITDENGNQIKALVGEGEIDALCYPALVQKLDQCLCDGNIVHGSVEILKTKDNDSIIYEYGYNEKCRIPKEYIYSGYSLLGVTPADDTAVLLELNNKNNQEENKMNEEQIKKLIADIVEEVVDACSKVDAVKTEAQAQIEDANKKAACASNQAKCATDEKNVAIENAEKIQTALDEVKKELDEAYKKEEILYEEIKTLKEALAAAKVKERLGELDTALSAFTEDEKAYAEAEIEACKTNPEKCEINAVISKIYEGIGKNAKANSNKVVAEQNSTVVDIFGEVVDSKNNVEDTNIF